MLNPSSRRLSPNFASAGSQRREQRTPHRAPGCIELCSGPDAGARLFGETTNVSQSGLAMIVGRSLQSGINVLVHVNGWPSDLPLRGVVMHSRRALTGTFEIGILLQPDPA